MFYIEKDNKIVLFDENKEKLQNTLTFIPDYQGLVIKETERPIVDFQFTDTDEWQAEQAQKERERINMLSLTKREVFLALYKDKGITPEQIRGQIINPEALIEFDYANDYYRGNPLINDIGQALGYSTEQLDYLFENKQLPEKVDNIEEVEEL